MAVAGTFKQVSLAVATGAILLATAPAEAGSPPGAAIKDCRAHLLARTRPLGSVRATASPAGSAIRAADGSVTAPLHVRIEYAEKGKTEVRRARVACQLDAAGKVVAIRSLRRPTEVNEKPAPASEAGAALEPTASAKEVGLEPQIQQVRQLEAITKPGEPAADELHSRGDGAPSANPGATASSGATVATDAAAQPQPARMAELSRSSRGRVFIHYAARDGASSRRAERLAAYLEAGGFELAELRPVGFPVRSNMIRFFHDQDHRAAGDMLAELRESGEVRRLVLQDFRSFPRPPRQGSLELWLATAR
jgi:hypothetical protein